MTVFEILILAYIFIYVWELYKKSETVASKALESMVLVFIVSNLLMAGMAFTYP